MKPSVIACRRSFAHATGSDARICCARLLSKIFEQASPNLVPRLPFFFFIYLQGKLVSFVACDVTPRAVSSPAVRSRITVTPCSLAVLEPASFATTSRHDTAGVAPRATGTRLEFYNIGENGFTTVPIQQPPNSCRRTHTAGVTLSTNTNSSASSAVPFFRGRGRERARARIPHVTCARARARIRRACHSALSLAERYAPRVALYIGMFARVIVARPTLDTFVSPDDPDFKKRLGHPNREKGRSVHPPALTRYSRSRSDRAFSGVLGERAVLLARVFSLSLIWGHPGRR